MDTEEDERDVKGTDAAAAAAGEACADEADTPLPASVLAAARAGSGLAPLQTRQDLSSLVEDEPINREPVLGVMQRRWKASRRNRVQKELREFAEQRIATRPRGATRVDGGGGGSDDGGSGSVESDDPFALATMLACCIITSAAVLWLVGAIVFMVGGAAYYNNQTLDGMWDDFQRTRARNLNVTFEELTGRAPGTAAGLSRAFRVEL